MITLFACGSVATNQPDASIDTASCVPDTDMELCAAKNACESQPIVDNCGTERTVDCGACAGGQGCVAGTCKTPVCTSFDFTSAPVPGMARPDIEDSIGAVTPDAQVILYVQTATTSTNGCGAFKLVVADETAPGASTYTQRDVSTSFTMLGLINGQDAYAISADGLTVIALSMDRKKLLATKRSAINAVDFGPASDADFVNVNMQTLAASKTFSSPVLSADGLELWYSVRDTAMNKTTPHVAVRTSTSEPFPAGTEAPQPVSNHSLVQGISSDRLTLFVFDSFSGRVFTRKSTSLPFTNPNAPAAPPQLVGWNHEPLADCTKLLAMRSPGGCAKEDIILLSRQ